MEKKSIKDSVRDVKEEDKKVPPPADTPPVETGTDESEEENDDDEDGERERRGTSYVLQDGTLIEMLYDSQKRKSILAVYKDGKVTLEEKVKISDTTMFLPLAPGQSILENRFIQFPSEVGNYESNEVLYREVRAFVDRYVQLTPTFLSVVSAYVMMTWLYDRFQSIPYLRVVGLFGTGKTRVLQAAGNICYKPVLAGGSMSMSALFRTLNSFNPSLVYDEAELFGENSSDMRQVLRQGYSADAPVTRTEKAANGKFYVQTFNVFGPKIMASQSKFRDAALESRCLSEHMFPLMQTERPIQLAEQFRGEALALRNKLLMFRFKNFALTTADESVLSNVKLPRLKQTGLAIVSVAKMLGQEPLDDVLKFLNESEKALHIEQADSVENDILICLLELLMSEKIQKSGRIRIGLDLATAFNLSKYEEYSDRKNRDTHSAFDVMKHQAYQVSPKKIGWHVRTIGFRVEQNREGFYIPVFKEYPKIQSLAKRYGLDSLFTLPDNLLEIKRVIQSKVEQRPESAPEENSKEAIPDKSPATVANDDDEDIFGDNNPPAGAEKSWLKESDETSGKST
ncbi:MAG: hypothetical protein NUW00_05005 [Candidatus Kaiserbacteria bacterium]|nr:hypothetical protein [Candidatus Kaiserbacteria bacterium]